MIIFSRIWNIFIYIYVQEYIYKLTGRGAAATVSFFAIFTQMVAHMAATMDSPAESLQAITTTVAKKAVAVSYCEKSGGGVLQANNKSNTGNNKSNTGNRRQTTAKITAIQEEHRDHLQHFQTVDNASAP